MSTGVPIPPSGAVWTQDEDFDMLARLEPALRVHRG
jgi:hypothetical protein